MKADTLLSLPFIDASKELKEGALGSRSPSTSQMSIDRSATPTPASVAAEATTSSSSSSPLHPNSHAATNPLASSTGAPIARSGLLSIRVVDARNINLPAGAQLPPVIARALQQNNGASLGSSAPGSAGSGGGAQRQSMQRRQCWWLPYLVLEFDKNEVLIDALGGDIHSPTWMYKAHL